MDEDLWGLHRDGYLVCFGRVTLDEVEARLPDYAYTWYESELRVFMMHAERRLGEIDDV